MAGLEYIKAPDYALTVLNHTGLIINPDRTVKPPDVCPSGYQSGGFLFSTRRARHSLSSFLSSFFLPPIVPLLTYN